MATLKFDTSADLDDREIYDTAGVAEGESDALLGTTDGHTRGFLNGEILLKHLGKIRNFRFWFWLKVLSMIIFIGSFVGILVVGLVVTDTVTIRAVHNVVIDPDNSAACLALKLANPDLKDDFRCSYYTKVGHMSVLAMVATQAGILMLGVLWISGDWLKWMDDRTSADSVWNMRIRRAFKYWKTALFYPHSTHYLEMQLHDSGAVMWALRAWTFCDGIWFMLLSATMGQNDVYQLIFAGALGFAYSVTGYWMESANRLKRDETEITSEAAMARNASAVIAHMAIMLTVVISWAVMYGNLDKHAKPPGYTLFIFLVYILYISITDILGFIYSVSTRVYGPFKRNRDHWALRRENREFIEYLLFVVIFGGMLGFALVIWTRHAHILI